MPIRAYHLISNRYDSEAESVTASEDLGGTTVKRASLYVVLDLQLGAPTDNLVLSVDFSPNDGATLVDYDKLLTEGGTDAPVASVTYAGPIADTDDIVDISPETVFDYISVPLAAVNAGATRFSATAYVQADCWLVVEY